MTLAKTKTGAPAVGIAGAFSLNRLDNRTQAFASNSTLTISNDLRITANDASAIDAVSASLTGDSRLNGGGGIGIAGQVSVNTIESNTLAYLDHGSTVNASNASVRSITDGSILSIAGVAEIGGAVGIGASAATNIISGTTRAYLSGAGAVVTTAPNGVLNVIANNASQIDAFSAAIVAGPDFMAVAFAISTNEIDNTTEALIENSNDVHAGGSLTVQATDESRIRADVGGFSAAVDRAKAVRGGSNTTSIGSSVAINWLTNDIRAFILDTEIDAVGDIVVDAEFKQAKIDALAMGGALAVGTSSQGTTISVAGATSVNSMRNIVEASIDSSLLGKTVHSTAGGVTVTADDTSTIDADAGGVAVAAAFNAGLGGPLSFGASLSINDISNDVSAVVVSASVVALGLIKVEAKERAKINALAFEGAAAVALRNSRFAFAGAGAGSGNDIKNSVTASIQGDSSVTSLDGQVQVLASDHSSINADAGAVAVAAILGASSQANGAPAIAVSASNNRIRNDVLAAIDDSTVVASGNIAVHAVADDMKISALTAAGAGSVTTQKGGLALSGAGAGSDNDIDIHVEALIQDFDSASDPDSVTSQTGGLSLSAEDKSTIDADAGGVAVAAAVGKDVLGSISVGASISTNNIANIVHSVIDGVTITTAGPVDVTAEENASVNALTFRRCWCARTQFRQLRVRRRGCRFRQLDCQQHTRHDSQRQRGNGSGHRRFDLACNGSIESRRRCGSRFNRWRQCALVGDRDRGWC